MSQAAFHSYQKSRFSTRLPLGRRYTASHFWIMQTEDGYQRVGFTKFATRMLGDLVEADFEVKTTDTVALGQVIGWVEGLKAASDLFCVVSGQFHRGNPELAKAPERMQKDPYDKGWLYEVLGHAEPNAVDAAGYAAILDDQINRMQGSSEYDA